jgi:hypothetical protein
MNKQKKVVKPKRSFGRTLLKGFKVASISAVLGALAIATGLGAREMVKEQRHLSELKKRGIPVSSYPE